MAAKASEVVLPSNPIGAENTAAEFHHDVDMERELLECFASPLRFVLLVFPWGEPGALEDHEGPDQWQTETLLKIEAAIREGLPLGSPSIRLAIASGHGIGKALDNDTPIPTPDGFVRMGEIRKGDRVLGRDGKATRVMGVYPQGRTAAYRVTFSDGASVIACPDHQWSVKGRNERRTGAGWRIATTRELVGCTHRKNGRAMTRQWEIPQQGAARFAAQPVPIDPYVLGVWLGDGTRSCGQVTNGDSEVWEAVEATYGLGRPCAAGRAVTRTIPGIKPHLARLGVLMNKHVPDIYKINDADTRLAVLQGLLDTDGECAKHGSVIFSSTDQQLAKDVIWLARSLGMMARMQPTVKITGHKPCFPVTITADKSVALFRVARKEGRRKQPEDRYLKRWIDRIEPVTDRETTCIAVSNTDRQFLCGEDFIVTHNTALVSWLILWFISTRPRPQIVVTANTKNQLTTKTWRELAKWKELAIHGHWFEHTGTQLKLKDRAATWFATAVPWSASNASAFAGTHEDHVLLIFDEASEIDSIIWETAEGAMTTAGAMWFAFGNPTVNTGRFRECWTRFRKRWFTRNIDSRTAKMANKQQLDDWIEDYGIDSDFVKVRVRGMFPSAGSKQFIASNVVDDARERGVEGSDTWIDPRSVPHRVPRIMGIDVGSYGSAKTVIVKRHGPVMLHDIVSFYDANHNVIAGKIAEEINKWQPDIVFIDATGYGHGVYLILNQMGYDVVTPIYWGDRKMVMDTTVYYNPRVEIWHRMAKWLVSGSIPMDQDLYEDLIAPELLYDNQMLMRLEPKESMERRGIPSPDTGDALAMTFAQPVPMKMSDTMDENMTEPEVE